MATLGNMTEEVSKEFVMKIKSLKTIKSEEVNQMLKKKPSYADYISMKGTGTKTPEQIEHFFATYAHGFSVNGSYVLELILYDKVVKWVIDGKENVLVCGSMSGDQMQVAVKTWVSDTLEGQGVGNVTWPVDGTTEVVIDPAMEGGDHSSVSEITNSEIETMVKVAVEGEGDDSDLLVGKHDFYDVVKGTSSGSLYVVIGTGKKISSNIAIRYNVTTLSLRCDPAPTEGLALEQLKLLGFTASSGSHVSCHLAITEGDPLKRYFILMRAALDGIFEFCDINLNIIKQKGK